MPRTSKPSGKNSKAVAAESSPNGAVKNLADAIVEVPIDSVQPHPRNPREGDVGAIVESIKANGVYRPLYVQRSTGHIIAGSHTWRAQKALGANTVRVVPLDVDDDEALRILLVDNRANDIASYNDEGLAQLLKELATTPRGFEGTGFDAEALDELLERLGGDGASDGSLLNRLDVNWGMPQHRPEVGQVWRLGKHYLVVGSVMQPSAWYPTLTAAGSPETVFIPYPGPYATLTQKAREQTFVMVTPDTFVAGHLLDKHASVFGAKEVRLA